MLTIAVVNTEFGTWPKTRSISWIPKKPTSKPP